MSNRFWSFFANRRPASGSRARNPLSRRPGLEALENRLVPAISYLSGNYLQNFDSLPATGTIMLDNPTIAADVTAAPVNAANMPGWQLTQATSGATHGYFAASDGSDVNPGHFSFGSAAATDRAFGLQSDGANIFQFGAVFQNDSGQTLTTFTLSFTGEQWRDGGSNVASALPFDFAVGGTDINTGTFTTVTSVGFASRKTSSTATPLDGNAPANRISIVSTVNNLNWQPGQTLAIRWSPTGVGDGLAIDNFSFSAAPPRVVFVNPAFPASGSIADVDPDQAGNQPGTAGGNGFQTIASAQAALAGADTIVVWPGSYTSVPALADNQQLVVASGAVTFSTLLGSAASSVFLNSGASLTVNAGAAATYSGTILGGGSLVKGGNSILTLTGANTYSGGTTIKSGMVILGAASVGVVDAIASGPLGVGTVQINGGGLDLPNNVNQTLLNALSIGDGNVVGTALFGSNHFASTTAADTLTIAGPVVLNSGAGGAAVNHAVGSNFKVNAVFTGAISGPSGMILSGGNGTFTFGGASTFAGGVTIQGSNTLVNIGGDSVGAPGAIVSGPLGFGTVTFTAGTMSSLVSDRTLLNPVNIANGSVTNNGVILGYNGSKNLNFQGSITLQPGVNLLSSRTVATLSGVIGGIGGIKSVEGGTMIFAAANTFSGSVSATNGILRAGIDSLGSIGAVDSGPFGTGTVTVDVNATLGTADGTAGNTTVRTVLNSVGVVGATFQVGTFGDGTRLNLNGPISCSAATVSIALRGGGFLAINGPIGGNTNLTKSNFNEGTLTLGGDNQYLGTTTISGGTMQIGNGGPTGTVLGPIVDNGALVFSRSDSSTFGGLISGSGPLTVAGTSSSNLNLANSNTYAGITTVKSGTLTIGVTDSSTTVSAVGGSSRTVRLGDTTGTSNAGILLGGAFAFGNTITVQTGSSANVITLGGSTADSSTFTGAINLGTNGTNPTKDVTLVAAAGGTVVFSGVLNESGNNNTVANVTVGSASATGTVRLANAANAYGGATIVNGGTLEIAKINVGGSNSSIGNSSGSNAANLVLNGGTLRYTGTTGNGTTNRVFTIGVNGATIDASSSDGSPLVFTGAGSLVASGTGNRTLTLTGSSGANSLAGILSDPTTGKTSLVKNGSNSWTLSGANLYTGATNASAGALIVNGSLAASSAVTVSPGATLGGIGTVGSVTSSGIISPGAAANVAGTLTTGSLALGSGTLAIDVTSSAAFDSVTVGEILNLTGSTLSLTVGTVNANDTFTILSVAGADPASVVGAFTNLTANGSTITVGSRTFSINYAGGDGNDVVLTALAGSSPPLVGSPIRNGGSPYVQSTNFVEQHSLVESVVYSFSQAVSLTPGSFTLTGINGTTLAPTVAVTASNGTSSDSVWTVTFAGDGVNTTTKSLGDGEYRLVLTTGSISNTYDFFRLLGDLDGNGITDFSDFQSFNSSFNRPTTDPLYIGAADFDGSNTVDFSDFQIFNSNFNHSLPAPLPPN